MTIWPWLTYFNNFLGNFNAVTQSCPTFCYPMDCNPPGSSVHGISQARTLECVAISSSRGSSQLRGLNSHFLCIFCISRQVFTTGIKKTKKKVAQSYPTLCDPMDYAVHGILQARILEWVAFPFSRDLPNPGIKPRCPTLQADSLPLSHQGNLSWNIALELIKKSCKKDIFHCCINLVFNPISTVVKNLILENWLQVNFASWQDSKLFQRGKKTTSIGLFWKVYHRLPSHTDLLNIENNSCVVQNSLIPEERFFDVVFFILM